MGTVAYGVAVFVLIVLPCLIALDVAHSDGEL